ncbi:hypothetical protein [Deinococcus roseus]|uniref:Uncharacterized protein n=1 Tax=Deinococcus roseus TaxID=392414 RepID=A0ABQ2CUM6_9DEIO|nr:hypothetical protein [Deinococcus roseus]GGJ18088.1 hypothetical protein GCM10008938_00270 [Deinococcus roseus]
MTRSTAHNHADQKHSTLLLQLVLLALLVLWAPVRWKAELQHQTLHPQQISQGWAVHLVYTVPQQGTLAALQQDRSNPDPSFLPLLPWQPTLSRVQKLWLPMLIHCKPGVHFQSLCRLLFFQRQQLDAP